MVDVPRENGNYLDGNQREKLMLENCWDHSWRETNSNVEKRTDDRSTGKQTGRNADFQVSALLK